MPNPYIIPNINRSKRLEIAPRLLENIDGINMKQNFIPPLVSWYFYQQANLHFDDVKNTNVG